MKTLGEECRSLCEHGKRPEYRFDEKLNHPESPIDCKRPQLDLRS